MTAGLISDGGGTDNCDDLAPGPLPRRLIAEFAKDIEETHDPARTGRPYAAAARHPERRGARPTGPDGQRAPPGVDRHSPDAALRRTDPGDGRRRAAQGPRRVGHRRFHRRRARPPHRARLRRGRSRPGASNLHGGGFATDSGSLTENIPIAALGGVEVVAVLYRFAPEHPYPAAVDDALAVYKALLADHQPADIGVYGTSAGAVIGPQLMMRLRAESLPLPGVLGVFSGAPDH